MFWPLPSFGQAVPPRVKGAAQEVYSTARFPGFGGLLGRLNCLPVQRDHGDAFWIVAPNLSELISRSPALQALRYVATKIFPLPNGKQDITI